MSLSRAFGRVGVFVETFGLGAPSDRARTWHALDSGATYALLACVQIDASAGLGVTAAASDWFAGPGLAFRVPR